MKIYCYEYYLFYSVYVRDFFFYEIFFYLIGMVFNFIFNIVDSGWGGIFV